MILSRRKKKRIAWVVKTSGCTSVILLFFDEPTADARITSTNQHAALRLLAGLSATESSQWILMPRLLTLQRSKLVDHQWEDVSVTEHHLLVWIKIHRLRQLPLQISGVKDGGVKNCTPKSRFGWGRALRVTSRTLPFLFPISSKMPRLGPSSASPSARITPGCSFGRTPDRSLSNLQIQSDNLWQRLSASQ